MDDIGLVTSALLLGGCIFLLLGAGAALRLPDLYSRLAGSTKAATLGAGLLFGAIAAQFGDVGGGIRAIAGIAFFVLTGPVAAHVIARAAYHVGVPLWRFKIVDELAETLNDKDGRHS